MISKTTIGMVSATLALMALAPTASAMPDDDTLSRTFPYISVVRGEVSSNGIGWYDTAAQPNVCIVTLLGVQLPVIGSFYYETGRWYVNLPGFVQSTAVGTSLAVPLACPAVLNPLCNAASGCAIRLEPINVGGLARTIVPQDGLVCTQTSAFVTCIPLQGLWWVDRCDGTPTFVPRLPGKGVLAGTSLEPLLLSADIDCTDYADLGYDYSFLLGSNPLSSGFDGFPLSQVVPFNNGVGETGYVVSCLQATYMTIDSSTPVPTIGQDTEDGVDYFLAKDLDDPTGWPAAVLTHLTSLRGWYDLGGNNDCDFARLGAPPECFDGIDNADPEDTQADIRDLNCWSRYCPPPGLVCIDYYDPTKNE